MSAPTPARSAMVEAVKREVWGPGYKEAWENFPEDLDEIDKIAHKIIAAVLDNLPREVMALAFAKEVDSGLIEMIDRGMEAAISAARRSVLGHE